MNEKHTYTGDKVKNHFTAYLLEFIRGRRTAYLDKKIKAARGEYAMEEIEELEERILCRLYPKDTRIFRHHNEVFQDWLFPVSRQTQDQYLPWHVKPALSHQTNSDILPG